MIRDWKKVSIQCFKKHKIVEMFHATSIEVYLEKMYLYKYLLECFPEAEAWEKWKEIVFDSELERQLINSEFEYYTKIANEKQWPIRPAIDIYITTKEIEHINAIEAPREIRLFILGMLIYGKYTKQQTGVALYGSYDRSFIYYLINRTDDFNKGKKRSRFINEWMNKKDIGINLKFFTKAVDLSTYSFMKTVPKTVETFTGDWIEWETREGYHISDIEEEFNFLISQIEEWKIKCPECGKYFIPSNQRKSSLCNNCYTLRRASYKAAKEKERRKEAAWTGSAHVLINERGSKKSNKI